MKNLHFLPLLALAVIGASTSLVAGPGVDYFKRVESVSKPAVAARNDPAPTSKCKVTETIQVTTGPHGAPVRQVIGSAMDCSSCNDSSMSCCAAKAKS